MFCCSAPEVQKADNEHGAVENQDPNKRQAGEYFAHSLVATSSTLISGFTILLLHSPHYHVHPITLRSTHAVAQS